jgi:hypothetical protein
MARVFRRERVIPVIVVVGFAYQVAQEPTWAGRAIWGGILVCGVVIVGFWDAISRQLPAFLRPFGGWLVRLLRHPVVALVVLFGLIDAAYQTGQRYFLVALAAAVLVLLVPSLRWRDLLRAGDAQDGLDLLGKLETVEGNPQPRGDGRQIVELPWQGTLRNTFVLVRAASSGDVQVEFEAILEPYAVLNAVLRYETTTQTGYMLRLDSRPGCRRHLSMEMDGA